MEGGFRDQYTKGTAKNRLTMRYDMQALKKIGDLEDSLREKLGEIYSCDPDDIPVDFDLSDVYGASSDQRVELLTSALASVPVDITDLINDICQELDSISEESKAAEKKKTPSSP